MNMLNGIKTKALLIGTMAVSILISGCGVKKDSDDKVMLQIGNNITEVTYKIRRAASVKSTTAKPFDYAEEVNKLSGEILTLKQLRRWWNKTLKELEARVHEDPTATT